MIEINNTGLERFYRHILSPLGLADTKPAAELRNMTAKPF